MAVVNGQRADQVNFNDAFLCKANNETVTGIVTLDNAASAPTVANVQSVINSNLTRITQNESDIATNQTNIQTNRNDIDSNDVDILDLQTNKENKAEKDQPGGYAGLDAQGRISATAVPAGFLQFQGVWDATTNTPSLIDGTGESGDVYRVSVAGTQDLGSGSQTFAAGDWVTYNGSIWERSDFVGASVLSDLSDVDTTGVLGGQALLYDDVTGEFKPGAISTLVQENIALVGSGTVTWNVLAGTNEATFTDALFISVPGLDLNFHSILAQTFQIDNDQIAYVTIDRNQTISNTLTPVVEPISSYVPSNDKVIFLRSFNDELYIGVHDLTRLEDGETIDVQKGGGGGLSQVFNTSPMTDYTAEANANYPVLGAGAASNQYQKYQYARIGQHMHLKVYYVAGVAGTGSSAFEFQLPTGLTPNVADPATFAVYSNGFTTFKFNHNIEATDSFTATTAIATPTGGVRMLQMGTGSVLTGDKILAAGQAHLDIMIPINEWDPVATLSGQQQGAVEVNTLETKVLASSVTADGPITALTFSGLEIGKFYEVSGRVSLLLDVASSDVGVTVFSRHDGLILDTASWTINESADLANDAIYLALSYKFQATATTLTFDASSSSTGSQIFGGGSRSGTYVQLEKRNDLTPTVIPNLAVPAYFESAEQNLGTVTWNAATPGGTFNGKYRWIRFGNRVELYFWFDYSGATANNQFCFFDLPADLPAPVIQSANSTQSSYAGSGHIGNGGSVGTPATVQYLNANNTIYTVADVAQNCNEVHGQIVYITS